jgi:hypothetical protein
MMPQPVTQATALANRLTTLKRQITVHNKLIARFILPIAATAYTDASVALEAVVHAPLKPLIEELQNTAVTMSPRPFAKAVLERYQDQVTELQQLQATRLDTYPDLSTATAVQYVSVQQKELVQKCFRFVLELLSMLEKVDEKQANGLLTTGSDFRKYCDAEYKDGVEYHAFLDRIAHDSY